MLDKRAVHSLLDLLMFLTQAHLNMQSLPRTDTRVGAAPNLLFALPPCMEPPLVLPLDDPNHAFRLSDEQPNRQRDEFLNLVVHLQPCEAKRLDQLSNPAHGLWQPWHRVDRAFIFGVRCAGCLGHLTLQICVHVTDFEEVLIHPTHLFDTFDKLVQ